MIYNYKTIKICPNQLADFLRFHFSEDSLKIKMGLELVSRPYFLDNFLKKFSFAISDKLAKFHYQTVFTCKMYFGFHAWAVDGVMTFEYLKS